MYPLPSTMTSFVGRAEELSSIAALLADPNCRLLTLVGPGGIGKTRLALEAARPFPSAPFVPLQPLTSPDFIVSAVADVVGFQFYSGTDPKQQLLDYLREKSLLIILDNFEHLLDGATLLSDLLAAAPNVRMLVTSRERLNLVEEWTLDVDGLEQNSAVELFMQHTHRMKSSFTLTDANRPAAIRICRMVGGMPLGIELAASWVRALSCEAIANEIERSLDILETPARNVEPRHRTMRAAFEPTWARLTDQERDVFMQLSVFRGGFTREAAKEVAGASLRTLSALVDKSLLKLDAKGRYDLHELLRQYAAEKLAEAGKQGATYDAHTAYFSDFCAQREEDIHGRRQIGALDEMERDFENIRGAWLWAVEQRNSSTNALMLESMFLYCEIRGRFYEIDQLLRQAEAKFAPADGETPHPLWGKLLARKVFLWSYGRVLREKYLQQALAVAQQSDDQAEIGYCLWRLGEFAVEHDNASSAFPMLEQSLAYFQVTVNRYYIGKVLNEYARAYRETSQFAAAVDVGQQSLALRREIGDLRGTGWCLFDMGSSYFWLGQYQQARQCLEEAIGLWRSLRDRFGIRSAGEVLAYLALRRGDFAPARSFAEESLSLSADLGVYGQFGMALLFSLGAVTSLEENYTEAQQIFQKALEITPEGSDDRNFIHWGLALTACGLENYPTAKQYLEKRVPHDFGFNRADHLLRCLPIAAILLDHEGQPVQATQVLGLAFTYPNGLMGWMDKWPLLTRLRADLETQLGTDIYNEAWKCGAASTLDELRPVVDAALRIETKLPLAVPTTANPAPITSLSDRELEVLRLMADGLSNGEIAEQLVLGRGTIKWYVHQIFGKLDVTSRTQAVAHARTLGLLP